MTDIIDRANETACTIEYEHSRPAAEVMREAVAEIERLRDALKSCVSWMPDCSARVKARAVLNAPDKEP